MSEHYQYHEYDSEMSLLYKLYRELIVFLKIGIDASSKNNL